ncbi:cTAGE family member 6 [Camelus dromedarius]|uniref:CTAGE family member 6 n=1 Tax=Camelus dromedarius TaxID=9838 RepID=A0A5N4EJH6_CAMDR|nr:cTAGE family member 6 [Camelus dromedarius]
MEVLQAARGATFQLILEPLWGALLLVYESLTHVPGLPVLRWESLVCAGVLVLAGSGRDLDSTRQMRDLCKKMAQDAGEELERTTSYHLKKIHFQEKRAGEGWLAAVATKRKLQELRQESDRSRQMLAQVESNVQPPPRGPGAPAAPPAAPRGLPVLGGGGALGHQAPREGGGHRGEGAGTCGHLQV